MTKAPLRQKLDVSVICPCCRQSLSGVTNFTDGFSKPASGDVSICWGCGAVCVFEDNNTLRLMEAADVMTWPPETRNDLAEALSAYRQVKMAETQTHGGVN